MSKFWVRLATSVFLAYLGMPSLLMAGEEKLLMGFERDEVAQWGKIEPRKTPGRKTFGNNKTAPPPQLFKMEKGDASQGEYAWARAVLKQHTGWYKTWIHTYVWFQNYFPADWSGYDLLRLDIQSAAGVEISVLVEDELVDPLVERHYAVPGGKWVTVELDLRAAAKERGLDLTRMANFAILPRKIAADTTVRLDNIRLAKAGMPSKLEVIEDRSPMALPPPPKTILKPEGPGIQPDGAPLKDEKPMVVDISAHPWRESSTEIPPSMGMDGFRQQRYVQGGVTAFDNHHLLLAFKATHGDGYRGIIETTDGGKTWRGPPVFSEGQLCRQAQATSNFNGKTNRPSFTRSHGHADGACAAGADTLFISATDDTQWNCANRGIPGPRPIFRGAFFRGEKGWEIGPPVPMSVKIRHCGGNYSICRLPSGRMWAAYGAYGVAWGGGSVYAKYSDDGGKTWLGSTQFPYHTCGRIPGSSGGGKIAMAPWGENVALFWCAAVREGYSVHKCVYSFFDGQAWSNQADLPVPIMSARSAVALEKGGVLVANGNGRMARWDGHAWSGENVAGGVKGLLTVANHVVHFIDGVVENGKDMTALRLWRRKSDGVWDGPKELVKEETPIEEFAVPPDSPPNFIPLAWHPNWAKTKKKEIKVLRVPVDQRTDPGS